MMTPTFTESEVDGEIGDRWLNVVRGQGSVVREAGTEHAGNLKQLKVFP